MATTTLQQVRVTVPASRNAWTFSGMTLAPGDDLIVAVSGRVSYGPDTFAWAFPEGTYLSSDPNHVYAPDTVREHDSSIAAFVCTNVPPVCLAMKLLPVGQTPIFHYNQYNDALRPNRSQTFLNPGAGVSVGVWLLFNDRWDEFGDNSGSFDVTLQRTQDVTLPIDIGQPSPLRFVPPGILAAMRDTERVAARVLYIKPVAGDWEAYTDWDRPITLPTYTDALGNTTPATTANPVLSTMSSMETHLKLDSKAADVDVLAPKVVNLADLPPFGPLPVLWLDRSKFFRAYYDAAYWEFCEVNPEGDLTERVLWNGGYIGGVQLDDLKATLELLDFNSITNNPTGDIYATFCQVGARRGEDFGTGRCRNDVLHDGPLRADWTVAATVTVAAQDIIRVSYGTVAQSGAALPAAFKDRMANGDLLFWPAPDGGPNYGYNAKLKSGTLITAGPPAIIELHSKLSLPFLPAVGDKAWLTSGCRRIKGDCQAYNNLPNGRFQEIVGSEDLTRRIIS